MGRRRIIDFIERNIHGAYVIYGQLGMRQYYYYTKAEAMKRYREEYEATEGQFVCRF